MPVLPALVGWLALLLVTSAVATAGARRYAIRRDLFDQPGDRRSHSVATPRGGGIGIVLALVLALLLAALWFPQPWRVVAPVSLGLALVSGIGWIDDHRPLTPWSRLLVHAVASALLAQATWAAGGSLFDSLAAFTLAIGLVNVWNFMDGIDGIAAMQAVLVAIGCVALGPSSLATWLGCALAAACLGFLPFNFPRARIFMGDVGSGAIGFAVAALVALDIAAQRTHVDATALWCLLMLPPSAFLVDAALTLGTRVVRGERWWTPHVGHAYQRMARRYGRHWPVTLGYSAWAALATGLALVLRNQSVTTIMFAGMTWYLGGGILWLVIQSRAAPSPRML